MSSSDYTIYHNSRCSTSRRTLQLLRDNGIEPEVIEYLKTPLSASELKKLVSLLGIPATNLLRRKEKLFKELVPDVDKLTNAQAIQLMAEHPKLMERPVVVSGNQAVVARPIERVEQLL